MDFSRLRGESPTELFLIRHVEQPVGTGIAEGRYRRPGLVDVEPGGLQRSIYPGDGDIEVEGEYYVGNAPDPFDSIPAGTLANRYFDGLYEVLYDWEKFVFGQPTLDGIEKDYRLDPRDIFVESGDDLTME